MALYESVFIARQDISSSQVEQLTESFSQIIQDNGGQIAKTEQWGLKTLTYRIKKNRKGHYVLLNLDAPAAAVIEMERNMALNEDILRYMTIRVDKLEEGPSAMMQSRGERGERRGREGRFEGRPERGEGRFEGRPERGEGRAERAPRREEAEEGEQA